MADLQAIRDELDNDPLGRGYAGMTDQQAADDLNLENRGSIKNVSISDFLDIIAPAWPGAQDDRDFIQILVEAAGFGGTILTTSEGVRDKLTVNPGAIFSGQTATDLIALWGTLISRAVELNLGNVRAGTVGQARAL